jgi:hypothetical protein
MAPLAVRVCGEWLGDAPAFMSDEGLHSHGDGLVYVHSLTREDVGRPLTLGAFAAEGNWRITPNRLRLWDDVDVRAGDACGDRRDTVVRWSVDGVEGRGDPAAVVLAPTRPIVLDFGPADGPVPPLPEVSDLLRTSWGPRPAG